MTTVIVVGVVGYGYIWWKGWKISDMMFVTRRGFSDACKSVGKQLDMVSSSVASAKSHLSLRIDHVGNNIDECKELAAATKDEVSSLHGDLSEFHEDVESVRCAVQTLETKLVRIEENQDFATEGVYRLCKFAEKLEPGRNPELIQAEPKILKGPHEDLESYLEAIYQLRANVRFFNSNESFKSSDGVNHANNLLAKAILKLEEEFKQLIASYFLQVLDDILLEGVGTTAGFEGLGWAP